MRTKKENVSHRIKYQNSSHPLTLLSHQSNKNIQLIEKKPNIIE